MKLSEILAKHRMASKKVGTGEMSSSDLQPKGEWYKARLDFEEICQKAGKRCEVKPFDKYQGPYAQISGGKLWLGDTDGQFYFENQRQPKQSVNLDKDEMIKFLKKFGSKDVQPVRKDKHGFSKMEIMALCGEYAIDLGMALENENFRKALKTKDIAEVERVLKEEF